MARYRSRRVASARQSTNARQPKPAKPRFPRKNNPMLILPTPTSSTERPLRCGRTRLRSTSVSSRVCIGPDGSTGRGNEARARRTTAFPPRHQGSGWTLTECLDFRSVERGEDMILRRAEEGAVKCAFLDLRRLLLTEVEYFILACRLHVRRAPKRGRVVGARFGKEGLEFRLVLRMSDRIFAVECPTDQCTCRSIP